MKSLEVDEVAQAAEKLADLRAAIHQAVVGQSAVIEQVLIALVASGHVLIEGVPGLGKTLLVRALSQALSLGHARVQFTPDMMPSDITGHMVLDPSTRELRIVRGPVFTHVLLADEINRAPAKTQSALLEVMQEYQVTLEGRTLPLPKPFMVLATQNPVETEGTYPLPEAQLDRFLFKIEISYPSRAEEVAVVVRVTADQEGTDFKQLSEYRVGDSVRDIDWRATLRVDKPIVREYQDERDQCVILLVDCGRRMRADDRSGAVGTAHFDQVLNAVMLLTYVALKQGDAVGAMTFGTPAGQERSFAPRKGAHALNALMAQLYDVQPTPTHSDYVAAAQALLRKQRRRALIIVITNFRDEDSTELRDALRLLRPRHLVMLASLRERVLGELLSQPLASGDAAIDIASAHVYEQSRRDAFNRLATRDALMVDAEPERLGVELVNRYHAVKRAGLV